MRKATGCLALFVLCAPIVAAPPVKLKDLKMADFEKLPDDTLIDLNGRTLTKRVLLSQKTASQQGAAGLAAADLQKMKARLEKDQKDRLEAQNARTLGKAKAAIAALKAAAKPDVNVGKQQGPDVKRIAPQITSIEPQVLEPGAYFDIQGIGFGGGSGFNTSEEGKVIVSGSFTYNAWDSGAVPWGNWSETHILGHLQFPVIALAQTVSVVVERKDGTRSAPFSIAFRPSQSVDCTLIAPGAVSGPSGPQDSCAISGTWDWGAGLRCDHRADSPDTFRDGTDRVSVTLKNGWVMTGYGVIYHYGGNSFIEPEISFAQGTSSISAKFKWFAALGGLARWDMMACAVGPYDGRPNH